MTGDHLFVNSKVSMRCDKQCFQCWRAALCCNAWVLFFRIFDCTNLQSINIARGEPVSLATGNRCQDACVLQLIYASAFIKRSTSNLPRLRSVTATEGGGGHVIYQKQLTMGNTGCVTGYHLFVISATCLVLL